MLKRNQFKTPKNKLEGSNINSSSKFSEEIYCNCPSCKKMILIEDLKKNFYVCPICSKHQKIKARDHINVIADENTFEELFTGTKTSNILKFPDYDEKLANAVKASEEEEAVITGRCSISGQESCIFSMEQLFMMGSMGVAVGEKITRLFEYAIEHNLNVIGFTVSGGARMQEGMLSLMQMAKISGAVRKHSDNGLLYIAVLCDPTAGGVTASFAMSADIICAEPDALICFAGPRVIEQTIRQKLPAGFQKSEFLLEKGFVDIIVRRSNQKKFFTDMLKLHNGKKHREIFTNEKVNDNEIVKTAQNKIMSKEKVI